MAAENASIPSRARAQGSVSRQAGITDHAIGCGGRDAWCARAPSARALADLRLRVHVRAIHRASRGTCGSPRITRRRGPKVSASGARGFQRLMRADGLRGTPARRFHASTLPMSFPTTTVADSAGHRRSQSPRATAHHRDANAAWVSHVTAIPGSFARSRPISASDRRGPVWAQARAALKDISSTSPTASGSARLRSSVSPCFLSSLRPLRSPSPL